MLVYAVVIVVALLIVPLTGGIVPPARPMQLARLWLLFAGLASRSCSSTSTCPRARWDNVGFGLLVASYVLISGSAREPPDPRHGRDHRRDRVNAFVITLNQGMPYRVPEGVKAETTVKHQPETARRRAPRSRHHRARPPVDASISFGDLSSRSASSTSPSAPADGRVVPALRRASPPRTTDRPRHAQRRAGSVTAADAADARPRARDRQTRGPGPSASMLPATRSSASSTRGS